MSIVHYNLKNKGIRLISSDDAWVVGKNKKVRLNPKYRFVGKIDLTMPNMIVTASDKIKPKFVGDVGELNRTAKGEIINHFYDDNGRRNRKRVAYFGIKK